MTRAVLAVSLAAMTILAAGTVNAQEEPPPKVRTTVVVGDKVVVDGVTAAESSGLTVSPRIETPAQAARRDAETVLATGRFRPLSEPAQPAETTVQVKDVVVEKDAGRNAACVQIGVVGARAKCRPPKP